MDLATDQKVYEKLDKLRADIERLSGEHDSLGDAAKQAEQLLKEMLERRDQLTVLNRRLATVSAESAELLADLEEKNEALLQANDQLSKANAHAAELMGEIEVKNSEIKKLNSALSHSNAVASELLAELELNKADLEKANQELEEANKEKNHLLGVVAHDMRSGLGGIHGLAELLHLDLEDEGSDSLDQVELIESESAHMLDLLASLLDVSSLNQGKLTLQFDWIDFNYLVREAFAYHKIFADRKEQSFTFECEDETGDVHIDPVRVRQACDNLLSNAIKYSAKGGDITVKTWRDSDCVGMSIYDAGPGLTEDDKRSLFRPFQKLSAKPTGGEDSHGLGLAITKQLVDLHSGRIWADNMDAGGCCFSFSIPVDAQA